MGQPSGFQVLAPAELERLELESEAMDTLVRLAHRVKAHSTDKDAQSKFLRAELARLQLPPAFGVPADLLSVVQGPSETRPGQG
jgi:hypothetical protein